MAWEEAAGCWWCAFHYAEPGRQRQSYVAFNEELLGKTGLNVCWCTLILVLAGASVGAPVNKHGLNRASTNGL